MSLREVTEDRAVLFFGDFNLSGEDSDDVILVDLLLENGGLQDSCDYLGCPEPGRIDRILFRSGAGVELEPMDWWVAERFVDSDGGMLSDHNAIGGSVSWSSLSP